MGVDVAGDDRAGGADGLGDFEMIDDPYLIDLEFANKANIEAARKFKAERDALWMALEAIAMRDQEFGFDAGKVAREALNSVVETPGSGDA